jgi:hypothetical protein
MDRRRTLAALALSFALPRCGLTGLDDFALATCASSAECEPLNARRGLGADGCLRFVCEAATHACVLRATDRDGDGEAPVACGGADCDDTNARVRGGRSAIAETCDGLDNNCDAVIDEGALAGDAPLTLGAAPDPQARVTVAAGPRDVLAVVATAREAGGRGAAWLVEGSVVGATRAPGYATHASEATSALAPMCRSARDGVEVLESCADGALALGATGDGWFAAGINRLGCAAGQVRVGLEVFEAATATLVQRGPAALSNAYAGLDVDARGCTGASRPAGAAHGAAAVALAASDGAEGQGLVAWLGDDLGTRACASPAAPVEAVGLWREAGLYRASPVAWVSATADGAPLTLGASRSTTAPALVAWAGHGFVAAYANAEGRPVLQHVPAFGPAPTYNAVVAMAAPTVRRPTAPLRALDAVVVAGASLADGVALAALPPNPADARLTVGVAWQDGCGAATAIWFARAYVDGGGQITTAAPLRLVAGAGLGPPSVVGVGQGFVRSSYARAGGAPVGDGTGGWLVAWSSGAAGVYAQRVLAADGLPLEETPQRIDGAASFAGLASRGAGPSAARLVTLDDGAMVRVRDVVCVAR